MKKKNIVMIWIAGILLFIAAASIYLFDRHNSGAAQEFTAEKLAAAYMGALGGALPDAPEAPDDGQELYDYSGVIDCLLEIPKIDMQRVVITDGDMDYNLDRHLFVTMRQDMWYGSCSYIIGGHQSFHYGYSMNRLEELQVGDHIYIAKDDAKDIFVVTEVCREQWGIDSGDYGDDPDRLAIYTCKKQKKRPKPYIVVRAEKVEAVDVAGYRE